MSKEKVDKKNIPARLENVKSGCAHVTRPDHNRGRCEDCGRGKKRRRRGGGRRGLRFRLLKLIGSEGRLLASVEKAPLGRVNPLGRERFSGVINSSSEVLNRPLRLPILPKVT